MKNYRVSSIAAIVLAAVALASFAAARLDAQVVQVAQQQLEVKRASAELERIQAELQGAKETLALTQERYKAGAATADEMTKARTEVNRLEAEVQRYKASYDRESLQLMRQERSAALYRPIDLQLRDATVAEAARVLSQSSGINIAVDKQVPSDIRLTMEARRVPLGSVLESMADQAKLRIAPDASGIKLTTAPLLDVNGERREYIGPDAPWSDEWGPMAGFAPGGVGGSPKWMYIPGLVGGQTSQANGFGNRALSGTAAGLANTGQFGPNRAQPGYQTNSSVSGTTKPRGDQFFQQPKAGTSDNAGTKSGNTGQQNLNNLYYGALGTASGQASGYGGGQFFGSLGGPGGISVAQIADRTIVVCEPGVNRDGVAGAWLTVYTWEGHKLVRGATTFHAATAGPVARPQWNQPGGFGGGGFGNFGGGFGGGGLSNNWYGFGGSASDANPFGAATGGSAAKPKGGDKP